MNATKDKMNSISTTDKLLRLGRVVLVGLAGVYMALIVFGNVTDYGTNFLFVRHVLSMDTVFEGSGLQWRSIQAEPVHHLAYGVIILIEALIATACLVGAVKMARTVAAVPEEFHRAKAWAIMGTLGGVLLFFGGFQVVAGEWFAMWQSDTWNGLEPAFRLTTYFLITFLALALREA